MRRVASFLLLGIALTAGAADIWRWKDANGVTHYSDSPVPGAERVNVPRAPRTDAAAPASSATNASPTPEQAAPQPAAVVQYRRCAVTSPQNDAVFNNVDAVEASLAIEPALQAGHQVLVLLNGGAYTDWPEGAASHTLTGLFRGSYTLAVRVLDESDRALCSSAAINFHVRQPSVLSPARQAPRPPAQK